MSQYAVLLLWIRVIKLCSYEGSTGYCFSFRLCTGLCYNVHVLRYKPEHSCECTLLLLKYLYPPGCLITSVALKLSNCETLQPSAIKARSRTANAYSMRVTSLQMYQLMNV
jgi:hypothetical protein